MLNANAKMMNIIRITQKSVTKSYFAPFLSQMFNENANSIIVFKDIKTYYILIAISFKIENWVEFINFKFGYLVGNPHLLSQLQVAKTTSQMDQWCKTFLRNRNGEL